MERNPWLNALIVLLALIAGWYLIAELWALAARFSDVILLVFFAWLLAFVLKPVARLLTHRLGLPRIVSVSAVYLGLVLVIFGGMTLLIPVITLQLSQFGATLGYYADKLPSWIDAAQAELLRRNINVDIYGFYRQQDLSAQVDRYATLLVQNAISVITGIASAMFSVVLVLVLSFYIMVDGGRLVRQVVAIVPVRVRSELQFLLDCVERTFEGFIRGQLIQCVIYALGTALVMYGTGLGYVLTASLFAGLIMLIPFIGPMLAIVPPVLIAGLQGSFVRVIIVAVALLLLQQIVINVITPKVLSEAVGLPPLLVILAMILGAKVAGVVGAIFGVPVAAVIYAMLLFLYRRSSLAGAADQVESNWQSEGSVEPNQSASMEWIVRQGQRIGEQFARVRGQR